MTPTQQYCSFWAAGLLFGIEVEHVQEVLRFQPMTPVPQTPPAIRGLLNLRGRIVVGVDFRTRLRLTTEGAPERPTNVVVRTGGALVSLLVDRIGEVVEVQEEQFEPTPETVDAAIREILRGAYKLDAQTLLLVVDLERILDVVADAA